MPNALLLAVCLSLAAPAPADNLGELQGLFANPPRAYCSSPLWVWNDLLTGDQLAATMQALADENVRQVFVHPRPGLMTPYLSDDWHQLWKRTLTEAERLDMNVWIYDENSYPSGFAGGFVPEAMPEKRGKGVSFREFNGKLPWSDKIMAVYQKDGAAYKNVTEDAKAARLPEGNYLVASIEEMRRSPWFGGWFFVDLLDSEVTAKFLEITLDGYKKAFGGKFPERVPGSFTDEPHLTPCGDFHWTPKLPELFKARWGYDLLDVLPSLREQVGDWKRVRHNFQSLLLDLFIENWAKPYYDYCAANGIELTGHYWEHGWPQVGHGPDNMAMGAWQQRPGIDMLFNEPWSNSPHAQVGNSRVVVELGSVANQMGQQRTLCEAYGGGGWDMRFEDMKRIGDWLYVLGVNMMDQHLSHVTIRGARKRDYPPSFSYHSPWWDAYDVSATYFARLSLMLSHGEQHNPILVLEPTTTAWLYQPDEQPRENIGNVFQQLVADLLAAQVEFDLGCEDIIARNGSADGPALVVGQRRYTTVVLPPLTENINAKVMELLEAYGKAGGKLVACDDMAALVDGAASERPAALKQMPGYKLAAANTLVAALADSAAPAFAITRAANDEGLLFHNRRTFTDGELLFLVNASPDKPSAGAVAFADKQGLLEWDLETGAQYGYAARNEGGKLVAEFRLPPSGSLLLQAVAKPVNMPARPTAEGGTPVPATGEIKIARDSVNVLTLDYVDIEAGGETKTAVPFKTAASLAFEKNGMERNPWDHAVQFKDEFLKIKFPENSGFTLTYRFTIEGDVPKSLRFVCERPDLYAISCNGSAVKEQAGSWWLDRAFEIIDIAAFAKTGENVMTLKATPFTVFHEVEAAFVIGDFAVKPADKGFVIAPAAPIKLGAWSEQGCQLYGHGVTYTQTFNVTDPSGAHFVNLPAWYGSVAKVKVNGKAVLSVYRQPFVSDVTKFIQKGANKIEVTVVGTLRNTLGPHHGNQRLGFAAPGSWDAAPQSGPPAGATYSAVKYGLFEPFQLLRK